MPDSPELHATLRDSTVQAQLRILLAVADGLRLVCEQPNAVATLDTSQLSINKIVTQIGTIASGHFNSGIENPSAIEGIWDVAFAEPTIQNARPRARRLIEMAREESVRALKKRHDFSDFETANRNAYQFIRSTLAQYDLSHLVPEEPATVEIFYDVEARHFCAGSSKIGRRIRWALQPIPYALKALLLIESILAHEYLSHLIPRNSYFDQSVREGWLTATLVETIHVTPSVEPWKRTLWTDYRQDLYRRFLTINLGRPEAAIPLEFEGFHGLENQVMRIHARNRAQFWHFTGLMLEQTDDREKAEEVRWLMNQIVNLGEDAVNLLSSGKQLTLNDLLDAFDV
jgi:hypothetical protein